MMTLLRVPLAIFYAIGVVILILICIPVAIVGFWIAVFKWAGEAGSRLGDRLIARVFY